MKAILIASALALSATQAFSDDTAVKGADRKDMLSAIRQHPAFANLNQWKMDVRNIWTSPRFGYVCALAIDSEGHYQRNDGVYNVYQVVLKHEGQKWTPVARIDGLSEVLKYAQCLTDAQGHITDAFLEDVANNPSLRL